MGTRRSAAARHVVNRRIPHLVGSAQPAGCAYPRPLIPRDEHTFHTFTVFTLPAGHPQRCLYRLQSVHDRAGRGRAGGRIRQGHRGGHRAAADR